MPLRIISFLALLIFGLISGGIPGWAQETSVKTKQFPTSYFLQYQKIPLQEKQKILAKIDISKLTRRV
jgi:hypothetical protein